MPIPDLVGVGKACKRSIDRKTMLEIYFGLMSFTALTTAVVRIAYDKHVITGSRLGPVFIDNQRFDSIDALYIYATS